MKNKNGSVLVWAIVIIMIFSIFTGAALAITYSMVNKSVKSNNDRQLYITARSATEIVSGKIISPDGTALINELISKRPNVQTTTNFFPADKNMGNCTVKAKCNSAQTQIIVTAIAEKDGAPQIVSAVIEKDGSSIWRVKYYDDKDVDAVR